ncbi:PAP/OAS1 substrate-binding domain-containing protein [Plenodomus tracheiphilus IPT5]|uniref:polynucleotide adenylyltransferase n=1 Tax=Plenodomus tracheiphilus IPT5 TaxID=1408161 RepID=A0A6A7BCN2_9PLEO|nr:PAP/OAS1 substrate-binding domain-containing protein [Plenodomus tracheiphilus IPT5]
MAMEQDSTSTSNPTGLEGQLRNMILGNVTLDHGQTISAPQTAQQGRGRGGGRGFGGPARGVDRSYQNRADQGRGWGPSSPNSGPPRGGGGRAHQPGNHYQQAQKPLRNQNNTGYPPLGPAGVQSHGPRQAHYQHNQQAHHSNMGRPPQGPAPKILQRPQNNHVAPGSGHPQGSYAPRPNNRYPQENPMVQVEHLDNLAAQEIPKAEMSLSELKEKEAFRARLEGIMQQAFAENYTGDIATISLVGFGSLASGFAMPGSDMDLAVVPEWKDPVQLQEVGIDREIPRLLERAVLDAKMGGRLLTRTRVPILKVCELPTEELYAALCEERQKWDELSEEEKYPGDLPTEPPPPAKSLTGVEGEKPPELTHHADGPSFGENFPALSNAVSTKAEKKARAKSEQAKTIPPAPEEKPSDAAKSEPNGQHSKAHQPRTEKQWMREKVQGPLDFPKTGCGIQCDINFENPLGIHNSQMLRCYSLTDPRVRPIVLFVKSWAKQRKVNSSYSGTLSSYGWVLMVLHYLVNIAQPPVCPNLQHSVPQPADVTVAALEQFFKETTIGNYNVRFWRNEQEIIQAAQAGRLSNNRQSIGALLRGFFQYYSSMSPGYGAQRTPQFYWTSEVLSLRTPGGLLTKQNKGWVSATTKVTAEKKVTNRYLFAIEDPFEIDHNVARTVTHRGIVAIRDEFRRAWRILRAIGQGQVPEGGLFDEVVENVAVPVVAPKAEGEGDGEVKEAEKATQDTVVGQVETATT